MLNPIFAKSSWFSNGSESKESIRLDATPRRREDALLPPTPAPPPPPLAPPPPPSRVIGRPVYNWTDSGTLIFRAPVNNADHDKFDWTAENIQQKPCFTPFGAQMCFTDQAQLELYKSPYFKEKVSYASLHTMYNVFRKIFERYGSVQEYLGAECTSGIDLVPFPEVHSALIQRSESMENYMSKNQ